MAIDTYVRILSKWAVKVGTTDADAVDESVAAVVKVGVNDIFGVGLVCVQWVAGVQLT